MRATAGRMRGVMESGVILGPNYNGEYLVTLPPDDVTPPGYTDVGYAGVASLEAALAQPAPRSVAEYRLRLERRSGVSPGGA